MSDSADPIRELVQVPLDRADAFDLFGPRLSSWWPPEYTWSQDTLETIEIEQREGGRCFERGPHGFECDWGRTLACEPGWRLAFTWQIGPGREPVPDSARATEVEVRFGAIDAGTQVALEHRGFERHGEGGGEYRAALASEQGWPHILGLYAALAEREAEG